MQVALGILAVFAYFCIYGTYAQETAYDIVLISNDSTINEGAATELVCTVFYQRDANVSITWLRGNVPVMNSSDSIILEQDTVRGGRQFRIVYLKLCDITQSAVYTCSVSNETGTKQDSVVLVVAFNETAFDVVAISENTDASSGESVVLTCTVFYQRFANILSITWSKDDGELSNTSSVTITERNEMLEGRTFRHSFLYLCNLEESDSRNYTCSVSNGATTEFGKVELSVVRNATFDEFEIVAISNSTRVSNGESIGLSCVIFYRRNVNISSVVWSKDDKDISNSSLITIFEMDQAIGGRFFRQSMLYLCSLNMSNSGIYKCSVSDGIQQRQEQVELLVVESITFSGTVNDILISPDVVRVGQDVVLNCEASVNSNSNITWTYDGKDIMNSSTSLIVEDYGVKNGVALKTSSLHFHNIQCHHSGQYECSVSTDSSSAILTITGNVMVELSPKDVEADLGENLTFLCTINGQLDGDVTVTWSINNDEIWSTQERFVNGKTLYVQENITLEDEGMITCSVQQHNCSSSSSVRVSLSKESNITASSGLSRGAAAGVAVAATAVTIATVGAGAVAVKVAANAVQKPPTDLIEKGGVNEDTGKKNIKYKKKLKNKCMSCLKKLIAKLKRAFCRRRRKNAKEKKKAMEKKKKNEKKKSEADGHTNGGNKEIENLNDIQKPHKVKKAHAKKKKSGGVKSSKVTKPTTRSKKQKPDEVRLEMEENTDSNESPVKACIQSGTNAGSKQTQSNLSHSKNPKKTKSEVGNEYVDVLPVAKEPSDGDKNPKTVKSPKSSNNAKKPKSSKKIKQDATQFDHVYMNPDAPSSSNDIEQGHIYETVA